MAYLFECLAAPTAQSSSDNFLQGIVDKGSSIHMANNTRQTILGNTHVVVVNNYSRNIKGTETRSIPFIADTAQDLAHISGALVSARASRLLNNHHLNVAAMLFKLRTENLNKSKFYNDEGESSISSDEMASFSLSIDSNSEDLNDVVARSLTPYYTFDEKFMELLFFQRKILECTMYRDEFDLQWGIDLSASGYHNGHVYFQPHVEVKLLKAIDNVATSAEKIVEMLKLANDKVIGIEIIHLFIVDLLGRKSVAANIFEEILKEDFKRTKVVNVSLKFVAGAILILMNVLFAYYSILFGYIQGVSWQRNYVFACVVQIFVEVFINETLEVVWMRFCIPSLVVSAEMRKVINLIEGIIDRLCDFSPQQTTTTIPILINAY
jgi:hypothetical protein